MKRYYNLKKFMNIKIRKASLADADGIAETHARSFKEGHREFMPQVSLAMVNKDDDSIKRWKNRLIQTNSHTLIAEDKQKNIGLIYLMVDCKIDEKNLIAEIVYFYIDPDYWRQGIGTLLWKEAREYLLKQNIFEVFCWVLKSNPKSRAFYESLGAKSDGTEQTVEKLGTTTIQIKYNLLIEQN